ncbi:Histidine kinase [Sphingomonas sp. EC-HK361]|uniref:ATP-binding protein n=1 Tax=Sphingomonas sp. EC-HK361 TaxID=2038397 RepID=UPI0012513A9D|nr:ATP-binding protein [Sphingomonas sp. EC-HK361]VVT21360.1 Histidine kinase [Sphingomonas sp. EC-HK361]
MLLLTHLRWLAVAGQLGTILVANRIFGIPLPVVPMLLVLAALVLLNLATLALLQRRAVRTVELFGTLLCDFAALTLNLYWSGGATNPFISLYLLQVVLGAVLLEAAYSWAIVVLTCSAFAVLMTLYRPLALPAPYANPISPPFIVGSWINFILAACLLVLFVTRIAANLRARDGHLAEMRKRAAEEEQIVRMGLLASGAAHELGTPLASLSVILGDWRQDPLIARDTRLSAELADMQAELARCKDILSGILFAAGEVTGQDPVRTTLRAFVAAIVDGWSSGRREIAVLDDRLTLDHAIVADRALAQAITNLLENAADAGATRVTLRIEDADGDLRITASDNGGGFPPAMLDTIGTPYQTTKVRHGAGLGLFLTVNTLRTLGGTVEAANRAGGGAEVTLVLPLAALATREDADG